MFLKTTPDSKDHGANMGPTWVLSAPGMPNVGPMSLAIRVWSAAQEVHASKFYKISFTGKFEYWIHYMMVIVWGILWVLSNVTCIKSIFSTTALTHCGLVVAYGDIDLWSTMSLVMAGCLTAPNHCLNQCWLVIRKLQWHSSWSNFTIHLIQQSLRLTWEMIIQVFIQIS